MRAITRLRKSHILDHPTKYGCFLFDIVLEDDTTYRLNNYGDKTWGGNAYEYGIVDFDDLDLGDNGTEFQIFAPLGNFRIVISDAAGAYTASDFEGASITVRMLLKADLGAIRPDGETYTTDAEFNSGDYQEDEVASWRYRCNRAINIKKRGELTLYCSSWLDQYIEGSWVNSLPVEDLFPSSDPDYARSDARYPEIVGTAYAPLPSVNIDGERYYVLGPAGPTYTITEIRAPREHGSTVWTAADNAGKFVQANKTGSDGNSYRVVQFLVDDVDGDGVGDANILFKYGDRFLPILCLFSRSDTVSLTNPADYIEYVLETHFGIDSDELDDDSLSDCYDEYDSNGLEWNGYYNLSESRRERLANLCLQGNMQIILRDKLYFRIKSKTSQLSLEEDHIALGSNEMDEFTIDPIVIDDQVDSVRVRYQPDAEEPMDEMVEIVAAAKTTRSSPSSEVYEMPLVHDSTLVQDLAQLAAQRRFYQHSEYRWPSFLKVLQVEIGDMITLNAENYTGVENLLIKRMRITKEFHLYLELIKFTIALDNWSDLTNSDITFTADSTTYYHDYVTSGPVTVNSSGQPNSITGKFRVGEGDQYILFDPHNGYITLVGADSNPARIRFVGSNYVVKFGCDVDGDRFSFVPETTNQVDFICGDYSYWWTDLLWKTIRMHSYGNTTIQSAPAELGTPGSAAAIVLDSSNEWVKLTAQQDSVGLKAAHYYFEIDGMRLNRYLGGNLNFWTYQNDSLADDGTVNLPDATSGFVFVSCNAEAGMWLVQNDGTCSKISGSTNTAATDSDGNLCVYDGGGTQAIVKNRLNDVGEIRIVYFHY